MKTTKGENTMTFEELNNKVDSLLAETNKKMTDLIDQYNESNEDNEIDTVDLDISLMNYLTIFTIIHKPTY